MPQESHRALLLYIEWNPFVTLAGSKSRLRVTLSYLRNLGLNLKDLTSQIGVEATRVKKKSSHVCAYAWIATYVVSRQSLVVISSDECYRRIPVPVSSCDKIINTYHHASSQLSRGLFRSLHQQLSISTY